MKTLWILAIVLATSMLPGTLSAQVSVGINIGVPLSARYYYLQDIEAYYDLRTSMYIYPFGGKWIHARQLPESYGHYDFDRGHKVLIKDYRGTRPYNYYNEHRSGFPKGGSVERNSWSPKERKGPVMGNKQQNKQFKQEAKRERNDNGNRGNGRGNGKSNGNGKDNKR